MKAFKKIIYLLFILEMGCLMPAFAGNLNSEWIKKHHGIIFYQDYSSDRYDLVKLVKLAKELGTDSVKTWIKGNDPGEIVNRAKSYEYRNMFDSFSVVCLNVCPDYILTRWDQEQAYSLQTKNDVQSDFYKLTKFLIDNYNGHNKTFIINYFFEVNVYMGTKASGRENFPVTEFISDAQNGVKKAILESAVKNIRILDCLEANCDHDFFLFVKNIFPKVKVDLYSISYYGLTPLKPHLFYWSKYAPANSKVKGKNIIIGEYGIKLEDRRVSGNEEAQSQYLKSVRQEAKDWDVPYIFLFWLADQESKVTSEGRFGIVDLDGHKRKAWQDLREAYY